VKAGPSDPLVNAGGLRSTGLFRISKLEVSEMQALAQLLVQTYGFQVILRLLLVMSVIVARMI
jgi:hypothetical protein